MEKEGRKDTSDVESSITAFDDDGEDKDVVGDTTKGSGKRSINGKKPDWELVCIELSWSETAVAVT